MITEKNQINNINKHIGTQILKYRTLKNMTQAELAEKTDTTSKFVSQLENGKTGIKIDTLLKYISVLDISPNIVLDGLFENSHTLDVTLENQLCRLNDSQKVFVLEFIDIITAYEVKKDVEYDNKS